LKHRSVKEDDKGAVQVSPDRTGAGRSRAEAMFTVNSGELRMLFINDVIKDD